MKNRLISILLVFVLLTGVSATHAAAITNEEMENAVVLVPGVPAEGSIDTGGAYVYYTYTPDVNCKFAVYSSGSSDTYGYLYDSEGNEITRNDDGAGNGQFRIESVLSEGQTYYVGVRLYNSGNTGTFTVHLEQIHSWGAWVETTSPSCTETGIETQTCICGAEQTREVPALGHSWSAGVSGGDGTHTLTCGRCGAIESVPCVFETVVENGVAKYSCNECGYSYSDAFSGEYNVAFWGFENGSVGWAFIDRDGDGKNWSVNSGSPYEGSYCIRSTYNSSSSVDQWAISPAFSLAGVSEASLSVMAKIESSNYPETFALYAGVSTDPDSMTLISEDYLPGTNYSEYTADLSGFAGEPEVYIAIRHYKRVDSYYLLADNVTVVGGFPEICGSHVLVEVPAAEPTCTEGGHTSSYWKCATCGRTFSDALGENPVLLSELLTSPALGHDWGDWVETTPPGCETPGVETSECSVCHETRTQVIPAPGHNWSDWVETTPPGCETPGVETSECSACHNTRTQEIPALGHNWGDWVETTPPDCETPGVETSECSVCHNTKTQEIPALGHEWGECVSNENGTHSHTCGVCGKTEAIDCTYNSNSENGLKENVCTECGYRFVEEVEGEQSLLIWDFEKNVTGWKFYDTDGDGENWARGSTDTLAHSGSYVIFSASWDNSAGGLDPDNWAVSPAFSLAGCTVASVSLWARGTNVNYYAEKFAVYAGLSQNIDDMVPISEDFVTTSNYKEFTADLSQFAGEPVVYIAIRHYNTHDVLQLIVDDVEITGTFLDICEEHHLTEVSAFDATCTENGSSITYWKCDTCGRTFRDAAGNEPVTSGEFTIPALGHSWGGWVLTTDPSCTEPGVETSTCYRCPATKTREVSALGHDWSAEYLSDDTHVLTCARCGEQETEDCEYSVIAQNGVRKYTCDICSHTYNEEAVGDLTQIGWYFEVEPSDWTFIDADGDGYNWESKIDAGFYTYEGVGIISSSSYINGTGAITPDNWAVSPAFTLAGCSRAELSLWARGQDDGDYSEKFAIYAGTSPVPSEMSKVSDDYTTADVYQNFTADLSDYLGEPVVYIAIRHYNVTDQFRLNVDNVEVNVTYGDLCEPGSHVMTPVAAVAPTEIDDGNVAYYICGTCGRYYLDAEGNNPVLPDDVVIPALGFPITVDGGITNGSVVANCERAHVGETVTLTVLPAGGYVVSSVTYNDGVEDHTIVPHTYYGSYNFEMPASAVTVSAEFARTALITGCTLSLEGDIGVNFYTDVAYSVLDNYQTAYMLFTVPNGNGTITEKAYLRDARFVISNGRLRFVFRCGISAKDMTGVITAQFIDGENTSEAFEYSVVEYAEYILTHADDPEYADAVPVVKAMLNYGAAAQTFFGVRTDDLANGILAEEDRTFDQIPLDNLQELVHPYDGSATVLPEGTTFESVTLSLKTVLTLSLYFRSDSELTFSCDDDSITVVKETIGDYQIARISGIYPQSMNEDYTLTVSDGTTEGSVTYSPLTYCYNVLNGGTDDVNHNNVVTALLWYALAVSEYFSNEVR
ncbi:MAG: choice-of-anchor J domain-containing protein [Clostridia bacterium]|nr:choice-of-anchor J domain-containing protein [Clostridia bacterium]